MSCDAPTGSLSNQTLPLGDGVSDRYYFLYVPPTYDCSAPTPLLVDFHGTAGGTTPEEAYQLDALVALADAENAIVVRPRSRSSEEGGLGQIYRWDQNPGDVPRNIEFTKRLVADLRHKYHIDPARTYASGFSSGSNMAAQFLDKDEIGLFKGIAPIAGGTFSTSVASLPFLSGPDAPRVYLATGYRDYLLPARRELESDLVARGLAPERLWVREYDTGHDLYEWHFPELFSFLDRGERTGDEPIGADFTIETPPTTASLLAAAKLANGELLVTTADGSILRRAQSGTWSSASGPLAEPIAWTGVCASPLGGVFAVGEGAFLRSVDGTTWAPPATLPELGMVAFGATMANGVACGPDGSIVLSGYWSSLRSDDQGATFEDVVADAGGYEAQIAALAASNDGHLIAAGYYDFLGGGLMASGNISVAGNGATAEWWNDVVFASDGIAFAVGDRGALARSDDAGATWVALDSGTTEDLYAVDALGPNTVVAGGRRGAIVVSLDGSTFAPQSLGADRFIGAVVLLDANTALVLGERGLAARLTLAQ
ncbi:MAG: PHB depolymerase family esterase [Polyangiaceae bacterium]